MAEQTIWLVIADASHCKIFHYDNQNKSVSLVRELQHRESKLKNADIVSDAPGHYKTSGPTRGAYVPREEPKEIEVEKFAREIANDLITHKNQNKYDGLIFCMAPRMSGLIHEYINKSPQVKEAIQHDFRKDFTNVPLHEMFDIVHDHIKKSIKRKFQ